MNSRSLARLTSNDSSSTQQQGENAMPRQQQPMLVWLIIGLVGGMTVSQIWPHNTMQAATSDRSETFAMVTSSTGSDLGALESVFVLDFLTGRLVGSTMNPKTGRFHRFYIRDIGADFRVQPNTKPQYTIATGIMPFSHAGKTEAANGIIYISELTSGKVAAYGYPFSASDKILPAMPIALLDVFAFREITSGK
ncbi:MAG: hypothetical protein P8M30_17185 [Planctomycetaceae bacterium]|nr:hypothetical protein [Planctomycetaceae bacterium]